MSLPQAVKDVSSHPSKYSVVDPTNKQAQAADVERKLRFYGVIQALRQGRLPSNAQALETLNYARNHSPVDETKLSPAGKKLVQDVRAIIETAGRMVEDKNGDEMIQTFIAHTYATDGQALEDEVTEGLMGGQNPATDSDQAIRHLRTLLALVFTNAEVRKLLWDFSLIGRELLSVGVSKVADNIGPSQDKLERVDEAAPNDQFITKGGRAAGLDQNPVLSQGTDVPHMGKGRVWMHPKEDDQSSLYTEGAQNIGLADQAREGYGRTQDITPLGGQPPMQGRASGLMQQGLQKGKATINQGTDEVEEYEAGPEDVKGGKKRGVKQRMKGFKESVKDTFRDRVPEDQRDRADKQVESGKRFFSDEYFPKERRDQFVFRLKKVVIECQKHSDYQQSMTWLLDYIKEYTRHVGDAAPDTTSPEKHKFNLATLEFRTILERFANNMSMDVIFDAVHTLVDSARRDRDLSGWFSSADTYFRRVLLKPGFILQDECNNEATRLRESGRRFYDGQYKSNFDDLFDGVGTWFAAMGDDPMNRRFGDDWARLTHDLFFDPEGSLRFKPELWNDIRHVIMPGLVQHAGYIPIPRIEYTDEKMDLVLENLTLQARNLFPNVIAFEARNYLKFSPYDALSDNSHHTVTFQLAQMQADMRDVAFYYRKKTGFPHMKDSGIADVLLGGSGLSAKITLVFNPNTSHDKTSVFKVQDVHTKVDGGLKFSIRDSKHDTLYKTLRPLATGLIKRQICKAIRENLVTALEYVDGQLVGVRNRMQQAKEDEGRSRADVLQELFQESKEPAKDISPSFSATPSGVGAHTSHSQFRISANKDSSLVGGVGHPAGWAARSIEKEEKANEGEAWKSEAFDVVPQRN